MYKHYLFETKNRPNVYQNSLKILTKSYTTTAPSIDLYKQRLGNTVEA